MSLKGTVSVLLGLSICLTVNGQTVDEIIAKYVALTGGEQKWKTIRSIVSSGIYNYGGIEFPFKSYSKAPNLYKYIVPYKGKYYAQGFDGKEGWKIDAFKNETKKTILTGMPAIAMANEADVELESPFISYEKKGHEAILEGTDTVQGTLCFKVKFARKTGETETYFFNTNNFELVKKTALSKNEEMKNVMLDTYYSDYRVINGLSFAFKSVSKSGDQTILTITTEKIELNVAIPDAEFRP